MSYKIYAIELKKDGKDLKNLIYLNYKKYDLSNNQIVNEFCAEHPFLSDSVIREDLVSTETMYTKLYQARNRLVEYAKLLEAKGYEIIAGPPLANSYFQVYIYEVDGNPKRVYVGESIYDPEVRFRQHCVGFNCSTDSHILQSYSLKLRPDLFKKYDRVWNRNDSRTLENVVANELRCQGYTVYGGH